MVKRNNPTNQKSKIKNEISKRKKEKSKLKSKIKNNYSFFLKIFFFRHTINYKTST